MDKRGCHHVVPVQAKTARETIGIVQIEQDIALCAMKFKGMVCHPVAVQFVDGDLIALFEFEESELGVAVVSEMHYRLVPPELLTSQEIEKYRLRSGL